MSDIFFKSFDHRKYTRIHNDLQNKQLNTKERCWNHFKKYGWREGRHNCFKDPHLFDKYSNSKLINIYQTDMKSGLQKIDRFVNFSSNIEKKIHIIIRTHLREDYFQKAIESIREQDYQNYIIHVAYDHPDSLEYIKKHVGEKMMIHQVIRKSPENAFFDLYCNDVKGKINDGWIMFLDDDNQLTHPKCLKIINEYLQKKKNKKVVVWSFLRPGRVITPQLDKLRYGDIDNCSYIFHHSIKNCGQFGDFYGSDFQFVESLLTKHKSLLISFILVSTQYHDKVSHFVDYDNLEEEQFTDLERVDFDDYKNHYQDLQHLSIEKLKKHYDNHGKHESRIVKFLDFDYNLFKKTINHYLTYYKSCLRFTIITTLYNETNTVRLEEYQICLEHHQKNQFIEKIVVFYDNHKGENETLKKCFSSLSKVEVIECTGRPYFIDLFIYSNQHHQGKNIIICNSDIIFDHTLYKLEDSDLKDKLYALTRWDYIDETKAKPRKQHGKIMHSSKDTWIFQTPFNLNNLKNNEKFKEIQIGSWNCDGALNYFFKKQIIYECLNIKSYHVHFCNGRTVKDESIIY